MSNNDKTEYDNSIRQQQSHQYRNQAILQGLIAVGFVAFGRHAIHQSWPICIFISAGCIKGSVEKMTQAASKYLALKKQQERI